MSLARRASVLAGVFVLGVLTVGIVPARAQARGVMADLVKDVTDVEGKIVGLANAIPESAWAWRPAPGVRSVGEVLTHVAADNYFFPAAFGAATPPGVGITADYKTVTIYEGKTRTRAEVIAEVQKSFAFMKDAMNKTPAATIEASMKMFGQATTAQATWISATTHLHEHLGQLIAYARNNKVIPPWSK